MKENLLPYYPSYYINEDGTEVYRKNSFISSKDKILGDVWYLKLRRNMDRKSHILPVLLSLSFLITSQFYVLEPSIMLPS